MHPHVGDLSEFSDNELEEKYFQLQKRYWQTTNPGLQTQITLLIEEYKIELEARRAKQKLQQQQDSQDPNKGLDNLINVS
jgi:predicted FMN-binding regulatory protein PaiB